MKHRSVSCAVSGAGGSSQGGAGGPRTSARDNKNKKSMAEDKEDKMIDDGDAGTSTGGQGVEQRSRRSEKVISCDALLQLPEVWPHQCPLS